MIQISYDDNHFNFMMRQHPAFNIFAAQWTKEEFETMSGVDASPYAKVIYVPSRSMYLVQEESNMDVQSFEDPTSHPALLWIHNNAASIQTQAEAKHAEEIGYVFYGGNWVPAEQAMDLAGLKDKRKADANSMAFGAFQTVIALANLGDRAGLSIGTQVNQKLTAIRTWLLAERVTIDAFTDTAALLAYVTTPPVEDLEGDIQWVMDQVT